MIVDTKGLSSDNAQSFRLAFRKTRELAFDRTSDIV